MRLQMVIHKLYLTECNPERDYRPQNCGHLVVVAVCQLSLLVSAVFLVVLDPKLKVVSVASLVVMNCLVARMV